MNKRAELHIHTNMSALDGINTASEYIKTAIDNGLTAIAITDHASVQAFPEAYKAYKATEEKIKLIYGMEAYMPSDEENTIFHTSILVKNQEGLKNLYRLISIADRKNPTSEPLTTRYNIEKSREGLLIGSGCDKGELYYAILKNKPFEELCRIALFYDYLEVVPDISDKITKANKKIVEIGDKINKPVVAVSDAHGIDETDTVCRKSLLNNYGMFDKDKQFKTTEELLFSFSHLGKDKAYEIVIKNTNCIADMIDNTFPPFKLDADYKTDITIFREKVIEKAVRKYGKNIHPHIQERIDWELSVICNSEFSVYNYTIGEKLVKRAHERGWTVGTRGSVASSLVAYLMGITEINPLEAHYHCPNCHYIEFHHEYSCGIDMENKVCKCGTSLEKDGFTIPAETFLGFDDSRKIDIDFNLAPEYYKEAIEQLQKDLGLNIAKAGIIKTLSYEEADNIASDSAFRNLFIRKLSNIKEATKKHPGKIFIFPEGEDVYAYTPIMRCFADSKDEIITHFHSYDFFDINLVELDILTHNDPSIIRRLEELTNISSKSIPLDDKDTMKLFQNADTWGISEFSVPFVKDYIMKKAPVKTFDDLIRISAISHGTDTWIDNAENLLIEGKSLSEVVSCRDDVMLCLLNKGIERKTAYKISEQIRKGKGLKDDQYEELLSKGIEKWQLDSWNKIKYSFPRAHSASYALYAYRKAYYKAHYPEAFYNVINSIAD